MDKKKKTGCNSYNWLVIVFVIILFAGSVFAYTYHAPIAEENKLLVLGEKSVVECSGETCVYNFSITNSDAIPHLVNINTYLNTNIKGSIEVERVTYAFVPFSVEQCVSWVETMDLNGDKKKTCSKTTSINSIKQVSLGATKINENKNKTPVNPLNLNSKFRGVVYPKTTMQDTINAGQTKYFKISFVPTSLDGELVLTVNSDTNAAIKASLDPPFEWAETIFNLNFNSGTIPPGWSNAGGQMNYSNGYAQRTDLGGGWGNL